MFVVGAALFIVGCVLCVLSARADNTPMAIYGLIDIALGALLMLISVIVFLGRYLP